MDLKSVGSTPITPLLLILIMLIVWFGLYINYLDTFNLIFFIFFILLINLVNYLKPLSVVSELIIKLNNYHIFFIKNNVFIKEGFYLDLLQKLSFDLWVKNFLFKSTQLFNSNYVSTFVIKFINVNLIQLFNNSIINEDDINLNFVLFNVYISFILLSQILFIYYINVFLLF